MPIPRNAQAIYQFLTAHGLSPNAAAGIVGNIEQESGGDTSAGGNPPGSGLIQQLGYPSTNTLAQNMQSILDYIRGPGGGSIADINAHSPDPASAALYFSNRYERPAAWAANNPNRMQSAVDVANAARSGNWKTGSTGNTTDGGGGAPAQATLTGFFPRPVEDLFAGPEGWIEGLAKGIAGLLTGSVGSPVEGLWHAVSVIAIDLTEIVKNLEWLFQPSHWVRIGAFILGVAVVIPGVNNLSHAGSGDFSLATGILMVTIAGILFFIAFHNLPADVKDLRGLLGWLSEGIRTKSAPPPLSSSQTQPPTNTPAPGAPVPHPQPGPSPVPPRTPPSGSHPAVTTPKPPQIPMPQPAPGG